MRVNDIVLGAMCILIAISLGSYSFTLPAIPGQAYGADVFPRLISIGFGGAGIFLLLTHRRQTRPEATSVRFVPLARLALVLALVLGFTMVGDDVGYLVASFVLLSVIMLAQGEKWWSSLLAAAGISLGSYYLFAEVLRVPLPPYNMGLL